MSLNSAKHSIGTLALSVIVALYLVLACYYNATVPLGEGPDEPGHAAFVFFLAERGRLPVQRLNPQRADVPGEGHQPPLAYALAMPAVLWLAPEERRFEQVGNPRFMWHGGHELNAVAHGSQELWPWRGAVLAWHLMRLVSALVGVITIVCTYLAAMAIQTRLRSATGDATSGQPVWLLPVIAAGLVAWNPQFVFVSSLVTNDALLIALSALMLWLVLRAPRSLPSTTHWLRRWWGWRAVTLGLVLGLALLTKQSAMVLAPMAVLVLLDWRIADLAGWRAWLRRPRQLPFVPQSLRHVAVMLATTVLVAGWWYLRNWRLYGDLLGLAAFKGEFVTQAFVLTDPAAWLAAVGQLHASFWGVFGWMNVWPPPWMLWLVGLFEVIAFVGLFVRWRSSQARTRDQALWPLALMLVLGVAWIISFAITAGLVAWQGRLLFPALPAITIVLALGLCAAFVHLPKLLGSVTRRYGALVPLGLLVLEAFWMPNGLFLPTYPQHTITAEAAQALIQTPSEGQFRRRGDGGIELRGWRQDGQATPGGTVEITLIWTLVAHQGVDWLVALQVLDAETSQVQHEQVQQLGGAYPTGVWSPGDWVADRHLLTLPAELTAETYTLRVLLYDPTNQNKHAGLYNQKGKLIGEWVDLGQITIGNRD